MRQASPVVEMNMPKLKTRKIGLASRPIGEPTEDNICLIEKGIADQASAASC